METKEHNGWTNYETWAVALWIDNDQLSYQRWHDAAAEARQEAAQCPQVAEGIWEAKDAPRFLLADWLKDEITSEAPLSEADVYTDLLNAALGEVNWSEIAAHLLDDIAGQTRSAGDGDDFVIFQYTRAQAISDGVLVDVTATAKEAGIKYPTAFTAAVWQKYVAVPEGVEGQDEQGRLWDIVWMLRHAILTNEQRETSRIDFTLMVRNDNRRPEEVRLKALCGPGDQAEPVLTVMLPYED